MDEQRQARFSDVGKGCFKLLLIDHGEAVAAGVDEEAFEAANACAGQWEDVRLVVCDCATPGGPVDEALALCGLALGGQGGYGGGLGQAVQGHVDQVGVASGCCCAGGGAEAFPLGAAGLVDVDVGVDEAG